MLIELEIEPRFTSHMLGTNYKAQQRFLGLTSIEI